MTVTYREILGSLAMVMTMVGEGKMSAADADKALDIVRAEADKLIASRRAEPAPVAAEAQADNPPHTPTAFDQEEQERLLCRIDGLEDLGSLACSYAKEAGFVLDSTLVELSHAVEHAQSNEGHLKRILYLTKAVQTLNLQTVKRLEEMEALEGGGDHA